MVDTAASRIIQYGADLVGASTGFAAEFLATVPAGIGGPIAAVVSSVLKEFGGRTLSTREQSRVGGVVRYAADRISARLLSGHVLRSDGFLSYSNSQASPSEELLEAVLMRARNEYQEKKLRYLGLFFANLVFSEHASPQTAHLLLKHFERLTYRQLCMLSIVGKNGRYDVEPLRRPSHTEPELEALKREEMDLHSNDLGNLGLLGSDGPWSDTLSTLGKVFYDLAALNELPPAERTPIEEVVDELRRKQTPDVGSAQ